MKTLFFFVLLIPLSLNAKNENDRFNLSLVKNEASDIKKMDFQQNNKWQAINSISNTNKDTNIFSKKEFEKLRKNQVKF